MIEREHRPILIGAVFILLVSLVVVVLPRSPMRFLDYKAKAPYPPQPNSSEATESRVVQALATVPYEPQAQQEGGQQERGQGEKTPRKEPSSASFKPAQGEEPSSVSTEPTQGNGTSSTSAELVPELKIQSKASPQSTTSTKSNVSSKSTTSTKAPEPSSFPVFAPSLPVNLPSLPSLPTHQAEVTRELPPLTQEGAELRSIYEKYHDVVVSVRLLQASVNQYYPLDTSFTACCIGPGLYLSNWSNLQNYGDHFGNLYTGNALAVMASNTSDLAPVKIRAYDVFTDLVVLELTKAYRDNHNPSTWPARPLSWDPELIPLIVKLWPPALLFGDAAAGDDASPTWLQANLPILELRNAVLGTEMSDYVGASVYLLGAPASYQDSEHLRSLTITASHAPLMSEQGDILQLFDCDQNIPASNVGSLVVDGHGRFFGIMNNNQAFQPRLPGNSILSAFSCYQGLAKLGFSFGMDPIMPPQDDPGAPAENIDPKKADHNKADSQNADHKDADHKNPSRMISDHLISQRGSFDKAGSPGTAESHLAPTDPHSYWTSLGIYFYNDLDLLNFKRTFQSPRGVLIKAVKMDSQASRAGFQVGDIIVRIAGKDVYTGRDAVDLLREYGPGQEIVCEIVRGTGQRVELRVYPDFGLAGSLHRSRP